MTLGMKWNGDEHDLKTLKPKYAETNSELPNVTNCIFLVKEEDPSLKCNKIGFKLSGIFFFRCKNITALPMSTWGFLDGAKRKKL